MVVMHKWERGDPYSGYNGYSLYGNYISSTILYGNFVRALVGCHIFMFLFDARGLSSEVESLRPSNVLRSRLYFMHLLQIISERCAGD